MLFLMKNGTILNDEIYGTTKKGIFPHTKHRDYIYILLYLLMYNHRPRKLRNASCSFE